MAYGSLLDSGNSLGRFNNEQQLSDVVGAVEKNKAPSLNNQMADSVISKGNSNSLVGFRVSPRAQQQYLDHVSKSNSTAIGPNMAPSSNSQMANSIIGGNTINTAGGSSKWPIKIGSGHSTSRSEIPEITPQDGYSMAKPLGIDARIRNAATGESEKAAQNAGGLVQPSRGLFPGAKKYESVSPDTNMDHSRAKQVFNTAADVLATGANNAGTFVHNAAGYMFGDQKKYPGVLGANEVLASKNPDEQKQIFDKVTAAQKPLMGMSGATQANSQQAITPDFKSGIGTTQQDRASSDFVKGAQGGGGLVDSGSKNNGAGAYITPAQFAAEFYKHHGSNETPQSRTLQEGAGGTHEQSSRLESLISAATSPEQIAKNRAAAAYAKSPEGVQEQHIRDMQHDYKHAQFMRGDDSVKGLVWGQRADKLRGDMGVALDVKGRERENQYKADQDYEGKRSVAAQKYLEVTEKAQEKKVGDTRAQFEKAAGLLKSILPEQEQESGEAYKILTALANSGELTTETLGDPQALLSAVTQYKAQAAAGKYANEAHLNPSTWLNPFGAQVDTSQYYPELGVPVVQRSLFSDDNEEYVNKLRKASTARGLVQ